MPLLVTASGGEAIATASLWSQYNNGQVPQIAEQASFQSEAQLRRAQIHNRPHQLHRGSHQRVAQGQLDFLSAVAQEIKVSRLYIVAQRYMNSQMSKRI